MSSGSRRPGRLRTYADVLLALCAGLLVGGSLPPSHAWYLAPLGVALLAWPCGHGRRSRRLVTGLAAGIGQFALGCAWAVQFTGAGYVALVLVESAFVAAACALVPVGRGRLPALAGLLTLAEWARSSWPFGGLPLAGVALGQASGPLLGLGRLGGPALVAGATFAGGTALYACAIPVARVLSPRSRPAPGRDDVGPRGHGPRSDRRGFSGAAGGLAVLACLGGLGVVAAHAPAGGPARGEIRVAAVQGGGRRGLSQLEVPAGEVLAADLAATSEVRRPVDLVVWPEDAVSLSGPLAASPVAPLLAGIARHLDATLVVGVTRPVGAQRFDNEAVVIGPSGRVVGTYEKTHPVPFGEYVPLRSLLSHVVSFAAVPRDMVRGRRVGELATPAGHVGILISYETFFPDIGRAEVRAGARLLVVPTNTASYASSQVPDQELAASRLQAVSTGRDLVQAASTGFSAVVDARGAVLGHTGLGDEAVLEKRVGLRRGWTLFDRYGELPTLLAAALASVAALVDLGQSLGTAARRRLSRRRGSTCPDP